MINSDNKEKKAALDIAKNKKRIFDQTASMHFKLSDRYHTFETIEDAVEIIASVIMCGLTFFDYEKFIGSSPDKATVVIGAISIFLFAFTLVKQRLAHSQLSEKHKLAGKLYSQAKLDITARITDWDTGEATDKYILDYINEHYDSLNELPQIPEREFNRLKHWHQSKVEMSKFLDTHQNEFWLICKIKFRFKKFREK